MNKIYVISDTHFGHSNILKFEAAYRPYYTIQDHDLDLVQRWNAVVNPKDTVWHLGDVYFGQKGHEVLAHLNGIKKLVMGNHDHYSIDVYRKYFSRISGVTSFGGAILSHVPVHPQQLHARYKMNIHGHMHSKTMEDPRYVCVSAERTGLAPVLMESALNGLKV